MKTQDLCCRQGRWHNLPYVFIAARVRTKVFRILQLRLYYSNARGISLQSAFYTDQTLSVLLPFIDFLPIILCFLSLSIHSLFFLFFSLFLFWCVYIFVCVCKLNKKPYRVFLRPVLSSYNFSHTNNVLFLRSWSSKVRLPYSCRLSGMYLMTKINQKNAMSATYTTKPISIPPTSLFQFFF